MVDGAGGPPTEDTQRESRAGLALAASLCTPACCQPSQQALRQQALRRPLGCLLPPLLLVASLSARPLLLLLRSWGSRSSIALLQSPLLRLAVCAPIASLLLLLLLVLLLLLAVLLPFSGVQLVQAARLQEPAKHAVPAQEQWERGKHGSVGARCSVGQGPRRQCVAPLPGWLAATPANPRTADGRW